MKNTILLIAFYIFAFSPTCKASEENLAHNEMQIINLQALINIHPIIFSHLDEPSARAARLVCWQWNQTLADQMFDEKNPHLNLPYSKTNRIIDAFKDEDLSLFIDYTYNAIIKNGTGPLNKNIFIFKMQFLRCPNKNIRRIAYTKLYEKHPSVEHTFLFISYTPKDQLTPEQKNLFAEHSKEARRFYDVLIHDKYQNVADIKKYFSPKNLSAIKNEANPNKDRNPIEIEALVLYEKALSALKWHKTHKKCCEIHEQGKKIARIVSIMSVFALIVRVYFNI